MYAVWIPLDWRASWPALGYSWCHWRWWHRYSPSYACCVRETAERIEGFDRVAWWAHRRSLDRTHWRELILDACQDEAMREEANVILRELAAFNEKYLTGEARP